MTWSIIGHDNNKKYFENASKNGALSHAYVFSGPEMIGKKLFAQELYGGINKREFTHDPDFKFISVNISEDKSNIHIKEVREIRSFLSYKPYKGLYKYVVVDDAHKMTREASNALLKTLEEPFPFSILILVSHLPHQLPDTILSRCQKIQFLPLQKDFDFFMESQGFNLNTKEREFIYKISANKIGFAKNIIDLGVGNTVKYIDDLRKLLRQGSFERMQYAKKLYESSHYHEALNYWLHWMHASMSSSSEARIILKGIVELNNIISYPQYSHRLALENFLLSL